MAAAAAGPAQAVVGAKEGALLQLQLQLQGKVVFSLLLSVFNLQRLLLLPCALALFSLLLLLYFLFCSLFSISRDLLHAV
jgi:uncharacterized membrane protein